MNELRRPDALRFRSTHYCWITLVLLCIGPMPMAWSQSRPNVLLIVSDDQGWPDLGCMGLKPIETPHLDRLATHGLRATNFYVTWPACTPSRGSLLTGRYPQRNGLYDMVRNDMVNYGHRFTAEEYAVSPEMTLGLDVRERTLGDWLHEAGYRTGMIGKWDMGQARRYLPLQRGFDSFYGHGNNGIDYFTHERYGIHSIFRDNQRSAEDRGQYITDVFRREALKFIDKPIDKPWLLYLCFNAPHSASSFGDAAPGEKTKVGVQAPPTQIERQVSRGVSRSLAAYYAAVEQMDAAIGQIVQRLETNGQLNNTLILFMSDNGGSGNGGNAPLRGQKSTMWEGGLRVPMIAHWPGQIPPAKVTDEFLCAMDLLPTILKVTQTARPTDVQLDGYDVWPVLSGTGNSPRHSLFWQRRADRAARVENWKWVQSAKGSGLFDLSTDQSEKHDLSAQRPEVLTMMKQKFDQWLSEMEQSEPRGPFRDY